MLKALRMAPKFPREEPSPDFRISVANCGSAIADRMPMIATTIINSINVNPRTRARRIADIIAQMILREQIDIQRPPEAVWAWISDPRRTPQWNSHLKAVIPIILCEPGLNYRYRATFQLSTKPRIMDSEIVEFSPPTTLTIRMKEEAVAAGPVSLESYELHPIEGGTRLIQTVTVDNVGTPFFLRALIWFIRRFGRPTGKEFLVHLKELVEN